MGGPEFKRTEKWSLKFFTILSSNIKRKKEKPNQGTILSHLSQAGMLVELRGAKGTDVLILYDICLL